MNSIQNYSGNELLEQLRAPKTVDITVNSEEKRLIELFRGLNQLGKADIFDWLDTIAPLPKYSGKGLNIYKKRSVQQ